MTFRQKLLAYSTVAAVMSAMVPGADATGIKLNYVEKPLSDSLVREIWADMIPSAQPLGQYAPWAVVATVTRPDGSQFHVSQLWAGDACGMKDCPVRILQNGHLTASFMACDAKESHELSASGSIFFACDSMQPTGIR